MSIIGKLDVEHFELRERKVIYYQNQTEYWGEILTLSDCLIDKTIFPKFVYIRLNGEKISGIFVEERKKCELLDGSSNSFEFL